MTKYVQRSNVCMKKLSISSSTPSISILPSKYVPIFRQTTCSPFPFIHDSTRTQSANIPTISFDRRPTRINYHFRCHSGRTASAVISVDPTAFPPGFSIENPRPEIVANFILAVKGIKGFNKVDYSPLEKGLEQGLPCPTVRLHRTNKYWFVFHFDDIQIQTEQRESK